MLTLKRPRLFATPAMQRTTVGDLSGRLRKTAPCSKTVKYGELAEWLMAPVLKTGIPGRVSGVRIPHSPPAPYLSCTCDFGLARSNFPSHLAFQLFVPESEQNSFAVVVSAGKMYLFFAPTSKSVRFRLYRAEVLFANADYPTPDTRDRTFARTISAHWKNAIDQVFDGSCFRTSASP